MGSQTNSLNGPSLVDGESILYQKEYVWFSSIRSSPTYRLFFTVPPLLGQSLIITNQRVLHVVHLTRCLTNEFSQWLPNSVSRGEPDKDRIESITTGRNFLGMAYIEIISRGLAKKWYRSEQMRIRLYVKDSELLRMKMAIPRSV